MAGILLAEKAIRLNQRFLCEGIIHFRDSTVRCRYGTKFIRHGRLKLAEIIEKSCNVGIIKGHAKCESKKTSLLYECLRFW